jgi:hypothetical protein
MCEVDLPCKRLVYAVDDLIAPIIDFLQTAEINRPEIKVRWVLRYEVIVEVMPQFGRLERSTLWSKAAASGLLGSILSKDPIRRIYCSAAGLVVETRQRRAVVSGAPAWWE